MIHHTASSGGGRGLPNPPEQLSRNSSNQGGSGDAHHDMGGMASQIKTPRHINIFAPVEGGTGYGAYLYKNENSGIESKSSDADSAAPRKTEDETGRSIENTLKGYLSFRDLNDGYFKLDSVSARVVRIANLSVKENDGATLKLCTQIIFEKATDEPTFGAVYALLCQRLLERISPEVKDINVEGSTGGKLFRKYLLHRCQEDFMRGWKDKASTTGISLSDKDGPDLMSDEYYVIMKAKRQGLGLIHFIGELFKLQMLTEKIMHECVKKLLANVKDPEEEEIEGLCKLMTTVGLQLDRPEARNFMDIYFARMTEFTKNQKLPSRVRLLVQDVIDLRGRKWVNRRVATKKAGDLSSFGNTSRSKLSGLPSLGPTQSVFGSLAEGKRAEKAAPQAETPRHIGSTNVADALKIGTGYRRGIVDTGKPVGRNRLQLFPHSADHHENGYSDIESKSSDSDSSAPRKTQDETGRSIENTLKGYLSFIDLNGSFLKLDSISKKVIHIANLSVEENDGATLKLCTRIIFEKATDEPDFGAVYALLCQRLIERISPDIKDINVEGSTGGKLFRKYLLLWCQEDFMRGWNKRTSTTSDKENGLDLISDQYYILMKARRKGLGLIQFIGELFMLQILTEKAVHECVKKLLANIMDPAEEDIEGLCKLMTTVGQQLDRPEATIFMDIYFSRMTELTKNQKLPSRIRSLVQDVIDLRSSKWGESKLSDADSVAFKTTDDKTRRGIENALKEHLSWKDMNKLLTSLKELEACYRPLEMNQPHIDSVTDAFRFNSISDKVIDIANLGVKENDGTTLKLCAQIIFEKATDGPSFGTGYALLCQRLVERISPDVKDIDFEGSTGGKLFHEYLLLRCQEEFMRGWNKRTSTTSDKENGLDLMSDEYCVIMKAKRKGLGLVHFIGELFMFQILTEMIMHKCVRRLLTNFRDPEGVQIECLCKLMTTVGLQLDQPKSKISMDIYFARMSELTKNQELPSRVRLLVQDVIDLRGGKWVNRRVATKKAGDLSSFGNASYSKLSSLPSLGPTQSVFGSLAKGKRAKKAAPQAETPRHISSTNIFAALEGESGDRRGSVDAEKPVERKRLQLLPRSAPPTENENAGGEEESKSNDADSAAPKKTEDEARRSIENTLKEYLSLKDMNELLTSVKELDACYRPLFVTEFVNQSMEMKQSDVDSIVEIFKKLSSEKVLSEEEFEAGFADPLEFLPDTAIDVPNAYKHAALLLEAAGMDSAKAAKP